MGSLLSLANVTISYIYKGEKVDMPFSTSVSSSVLSEEEYEVYMKARDDHIRRWSRMYSDSFLESEYRYDPVQ
jgi:hypothetical protein